MLFFRPTVLSSSKRPQLLPNEALILQQANTGLYEEGSKVEGYQDGVLYLTSHRIIYVDKHQPLDYSVDLPIQAITQVEQYGGFLRSSPKLILSIDLEVLKGVTATADLLLLETDTLSVQAAKARQVAALVGAWTCAICSHDNTLLTNKCALCGVRMTAVPDSAHEGGSNGTDTPANSCPVCTFINHESMTRCEMCDTPLDGSATPTPLPTISATPSPSSTTAKQQGKAVQLAFRKGGMQHFCNKLATAMEQKKWQASTKLHQRHQSASSSSSSSSSSTPLTDEAQQQSPLSASRPRAVGIQGIQDKLDRLQIDTTDTVAEGFQDLQQLMAKATEMVALAETISSKLNNSSQKADDADLFTLRGYMINLGISNPVTRGTAGSIYHQELARELSEFLSKLMTDKQRDIWTLTDIYCIFNRARGVALISPQDLHKACQQFQALQLPFRLRQLDEKGLLTVQSVHMDDRLATTRVLDYLKSHNGTITALQLASIENWAIAVALDQLKMIERNGILCRDESPAGLVFFENIYMK
ncbi:EAP30/Vps36 family-domain-containing protein [Gongronella butleri]|nr:EAP30/Vps36 family-domain-containing protein [Gongronella butleri]